MSLKVILASACPHRRYPVLDRHARELATNEECARLNAISLGIPA
jgi:hypothetical protein